MDIAAIIEVIAKVIDLAVKVGPTVIKGVEDAKPFARVIFNNLVNKKEITPEELLAIEAQIDRLSAELQQPLPEEK